MKQLRPILPVLIACALLGAYLLWSGARLVRERQLTPLEAQASAVLTEEGAALLVVIVLLVLLRGTFADLLLAPPERRRARPRTDLLVISFTALFVELMLIRYCGSQIRIFSFYRNVPLIGSFLGLGLGCAQGRGGPREVQRFLLWLVPFAAFMAAGSIAVDGLLGQLAAIGSTEHILGDFVVANVTPEARLAAQLAMAAFCLVTLVAVTSLFSLLGRILGDAFDGVARLHGYTINILGSLLGVLAFVAVSYAETPPWLWFLVGLSPLLLWTVRARERIAALALLFGSALLVAPSIGQTVWSPYQKLVGSPMADAGIPGVAPGYEVQISDVFYQEAVDLSSRAIAARGWNPFPHYDLAYERLPSRPERVLIVGAGTGNDVAAALRAGASDVQAVDIDPAIVAMGRAHHPERPYDDPRVHVVVDDARDAFRRSSPGSFDVVIFGLLDSHTQLGASSVRLDNYVFTLESFRSARRLLRPGGHVVVTAACFQDWFGKRIGAMLETAFGNVQVFPPAQGYWWQFISRNDAASGATAEAGAALPTDDWPFLYLPSRGIPRSYLFVVLLLAAASALTLRVGGLRAGTFTAFRGHLFCLGAAFLLMEVHAVNRLALLFGTTWIVSALAIVLVLGLIVAANLTVIALGPLPHAVSYGGLVVALVASFAVGPDVALGHTALVRLAYGTLLVSPIYFAGLVFARSFARARIASAAIGYNILGSVLGGWIEYATMAVGIRALVLIALSLYLLSLVFLQAWGGRDDADASRIA